MFREEGLGTTATTVGRKPGLAVMLLLLVGVLSVLLWGDYLPENILFSNDGPLGRLVAQCHQLPARFTGCWDDLNLLGFRDWGASPSISYGLEFLLGPVGFAKLYAPVGLLLLGLGAWCFFRQSGLAPGACLLGGLAATLGSSFFSAACWGVASHAITVGMVFFALAAFADTSSRGRWLRVVLAGLAVGMSVTEGADIGALFSVYVAAFVVYQAWLAEGPRVKNMVAGVGRVALLAVCAALLAAQAISGLVSTEIKGVAGTQQDAETKEAHWDWATQWSLPKMETLGMVVPGLFGYRMDTPEGLPKGLQEYYRGGNYWGAGGRDPAWYRYFERGPLRAGDAVEITLGRSPNLDTQRLIRDDGKVALPSGGEVRAAGLTPAELRQEIIKRNPQIASQEITVAMEAPPGFTSVELGITC